MAACPTIVPTIHICLLFIPREGMETLPYDFPEQSPVIPVITKPAKKHLIFDKATIIIDKVRASAGCIFGDVA